MLAQTFIGLINEGLTEDVFVYAVLLRLVHHILSCELCIFLSILSKFRKAMHELSFKCLCELFHTNVMISLRQQLLIFFGVSFLKRLAFVNKFLSHMAISLLLFLWNMFIALFGNIQKNIIRAINITCRIVLQ